MAVLRVGSDIYSYLLQGMERKTSAEIWLILMCELCCGIEKSTKLRLRRERVGHQGAVHETTSEKGIQGMLEAVIPPIYFTNIASEPVLVPIAD